MQVTDPRTGETVYLFRSEAYATDMMAAYAECQHPDSELRRFTNRNGGTAACRQCLTCGTRVGNPLGGQNHAALPPADDGLQDAYIEAQRAKRDAVLIKHIDAQSSQDAEWWAKYDAYLQTPEWRHRRDLVLKRCGRVCEGCGEAEATEVHHMTYEHAFAEFLFELKGMCHTCHVRWHDSERRA